MGGYAEQHDSARRRALFAMATGATLLLGGGAFSAGWAFGAAGAAPPAGAAPNVAAPAGPSPSAGPTHVVAGVPEGFAHSASGSVRALVAMLQVQAGPLLLHPDGYRAAWQQMCTPGYWAATGRRGADQMLDALAVHGQLLASAARGEQVYVHLFPLTTGVVDYTGVRSSVQLWSLIVVHPGNGPTKAVFDGVTADLAWDGSNWKLDGGRTFATSDGGSTGGFALTVGPGLPPFLTLPGVDGDAAGS